MTLLWLAKGFLGVIIMAAFLFIPAGRLDWAMGWVYLGLQAALIVLAAVLISPELLAERAQRKHGDQKGWDKILFPVYGNLLGFAVPVLAGFNARWDWTPRIPIGIQFAALALSIPAWGLHFWAMRVNAFFSQVVRIQTDRGQTVCTEGPYRVVRHPGYAGGIILTLAAPLILGSFWAFLAGVAAAALLIVRTALEDRMLQDELPGYKEYAAKVRSRLVPGIR